MPTSSEIRQQFLDFFCKKHGHTFVPSSPVVPHDDPTLLFTNAGMNQFKPIFLGQEKRGYTRAANTQKCIRAGGKHNDLDDVGRSRRHHTFFEMLGNWSFGDYFKAGAIEMAWELLTKTWKLDPERLHVSCFKGDEKNGVPRDTEAADLWKKIAGVRDDHIHYFGKDNFWEMGDTGPCGPCTEIYYDRTPDKTGGPQVNGDDPRVMEIWNLVFIQYNRNADRTLSPLPAQHVDTGMGFERICQVLQNVDSNYSIDLWDTFFEKLTQLTGKKYVGKFPKTNAPDPAAEAADPQLRSDIAFRVIADHVRCLTFALTDGAVPSNEGRGYVLRRILRRAVRFCRQQLELKQPFLFEMVDIVVESMGDAFAELKRDPRRVRDLVREEEVSFGKTLDRGIELFDEAAQSAIGNRQSAISASDAFKLHDTYGFPIDLTEQMAVERGMTVDIAGYETLMEEARDKARAGGKGGESVVYQLPAGTMAELHKSGVQPTNDTAKFIDAPISAVVKAIWTGGDLTKNASQSDSEIAVLLDRTNFYTEMGGQVGDAGQLASTDSNFAVRTTRAVGGYVLHVGKVAIGTLSVGDPVKTIVDDSRRATMGNHTATHLANWALRETLGDAVQQKGSLVDPEKLRFDFIQNSALQDENIEALERLVGECVAKKLPVFAEEAPQEQALKIAGLRAVFGEKYPPMVRVVSVGAPVAELLENPSDAKWRKFSVEFCGGTHVGNSADVGAFVVTAEESVSKGVRRIVAVTGVAADAARQAQAELDRQVVAAQSTDEANLPAMLADLQKLSAAENVPLLAKRRAQAAIATLRDKHKKWTKSQKSAGGSVDVAAVAGELLASAEDCSGGKIIVAEVAGASDEQLRGVIESIKKRQPNFAALLAASDGEKVSFVAAVGDELIARGLKAGDWAKEAAKTTGGSGGGRPNMAQAGGKDPKKLAAALDAARAFMAQVLK